jgi:quercetin dioxygenase-like cupin family protein
MPAIIRKSLDSPEEVRPFKDGKGQINLVNLDASPVSRAVLEPGWRWSLHVKPIVQTDSCEAPHTGYLIAGQLTVAMADGEQVTFGPGDFMMIPPGHDAWVVGDEPCTFIDWQGYADYAKP